MARGWFNLESGPAAGVMPENQYFEGDSAFKFLNLSWKARLYGFIGCCATGFILSVLGAVLFFLGQLGLFAVFYVLGTITALVGTGFLIGFFKQLKLMFKPIRVVASIVFLGSIAMVLIAAFVLGNDLLAIIFVIIQYLAYLWYSLSYIPYARKAILKMFGMG